ncbi:GNAT family N-acetyltransferase [Donghicola sp. C2-DW-16]|uniref:GNAT family N-acetyltransferase n=1 Tax=Donghicola mangrovi TaxID=2729614 RepID=A0ABX2PGS6_9RHOB|nr:GNAT family N-acetyltransferase [Donghicola mangrovi]NVO28274.1 GNAT family N-acetyltransferase [Donghicola mangrovi]
MDGFFSEIKVSDGVLEMRPLTIEDREGLYQAASDPATWAQHPAKGRYQREAFWPYFDFLLHAGDVLVAVEAESGRIIGCSRFYAVPDQPGDVAIGFTFLDRAYWGGSWNRRMKALMVGHVLETRPRVWLHIAPDNLRSQIASTRLGAVHQYDAELDLGTGLAPYKCYTITADSWAAAMAERAGA